MTGDKVAVAFVDQGDTGEEPAAQATAYGMRLEAVKLQEAKRGFVLLPRRWVVECSFAWAARFRRLARDSERPASSLAGLHWLAFASLMLNSLFRQSAGQALTSRVPRTLRIKPSSHACAAYSTSE